MLENEEEGNILVKNQTKNQDKYSCQKNPVEKSSKFSSILTLALSNVL